MSEPLEFRKEARIIAELDPYRLCPTVEMRTDILDRALREAAAKALEWAGCQFFVMRTLDDGPAADPLAEVIAELRKP